jgi:aminopeptidase N
MHLDLYLAGRGYQKEMPLYCVDFESPYLIYNKGFVVMYQLEQLIGERNVNNALKHFFQQHRYPYPTPISADLINSFYIYSPKELHSKIDELFKEVITSDAKLEGVTYKMLDNKNYEINITGSLKKFNNSTGAKVQELPTEGTIDVGYKGNKWSAICFFRTSCKQ